jgi:hypothetical protein
VASSVASADDGASIRLRRVGEARTQSWLHLDATTIDRADAEGGIVDSRAALLDLGPRTRLAAEGKWWQSGLAPSRFAEDLRNYAWRVSAEISYDLGPFRIGVDASMERVGDSTHRMVGLFAYRTFRLSRWMHAWIAVGVSFERWDDAAPRGTLQGASVGLSVGTTFR